MVYGWIMVIIVKVDTIDWGVKMDSGNWCEDGKL